MNQASPLVRRSPDDSLMMQECSRSPRMQKQKDTVNHRYQVSPLT